MKTYYFLGIGGIGMSAIARYFLLKGDNIFGYDLTRTELTQELEKEGMSIVYEDNIDLLPKDIDMVIYTPAIPKDNTIFNYFLNSNTPILKRSEILEEITRDTKTIAI